MFRVISCTFLTVLTVDLLATSGDVTFTWPSPILPKLHSNDSDNPLGSEITSDEETWIGSLINIGALIGPLPYSYLSERFGRKIALLCVAVPHICSFLILAFARNVYLFYFARVLGGIALGGGYTLLPMYIAEIAEDNNRGALSVTLNIFWTIGNLLPYVLGPYLPIMWFNIVLALIPTTFFVLFLLSAPETPYYLVANNRMTEAEAALVKLRPKSKAAVRKEIEHIKLMLESDEHGHFMDLFKSRVCLKALGISVCLIVAQQFSGINAVLAYTQFIFEAANSHLAPTISSMLVGLVNFLTSFASPFIADRLGRKFLLLVSTMGMCLAQASIGIYFYLKESTSIDTNPIGFLPVLSLLLYIITYSFGFSVVPWTLSSELFPRSVKSAAAPIVSAACFLASFFVTKFFNDMNSALGDSGTFLVYSGSCMFAFLFTFFVVPETKGKSFQEIQQILDKST